MRSALCALSVELTEGPLYDAHLALCRYLEGHNNCVPHPHVLAHLERRLKAEEQAVLMDFQTLLKDGMPHPRHAETFTAIGRLHANGTTPWWSEVWRWPAWIVFKLTTGWWPILIEKRMAELVKDPAYRTTFGIPLFLFCVSTTWGLLSLTVACFTHNMAVGLFTILMLRLSQAVAMPYEDRRLDRRNEREAQPY